ncbi:MAG TPA: TauD/TfdA family dioxygenase [Microthrixaceae bacterium]|nr:TauD/TfdA family dioxygenase [Microthrixaceae bacterium]
MPALRSPFEPPAFWRSEDITGTDDWSVQFSDLERDEIIAAVRSATEGQITVASITAADFPLPSLSARLSEWSQQLNLGRGFLLLRGFPIEHLSDEEIELAYVGLGAHLGTPVGQDRDATLLGHVRDEGIERVDPSVRFYRTKERQDFHTDGADLVALLCLHRAVRGGESRIASSAAVYNEILRTRPDLLEVLYEPFCWDRNNEQSAGEAPFFELPVCNDVNGVPRFFYIGWYIRDAQRHPEVPRLTDEQHEALALVESIANDPAVHLEMEFQPGDIQLLNNARMLHARAAYEDSGNPAERRHLLRLWLAAHDFTGVDDLLNQGIPQQQL